MAARNMIGVDQLCIGLHIKLEGWGGHPFLLNSFKLKEQKQIDALKALGLKEIEYLPKKSEAQPLQLPAAPVLTDAPAVNMDALMKEKQQHIEQLSTERAMIQQAERKYAKTAATVKNAIRLANSNPLQAAERAAEVAGELSQIFLAQGDPFIHLMGDHVTDDGGHFHGLNVAMLSLILAQAVGIDEPVKMQQIAQGALLHDVGKVQVPSQVLLKDDGLTSAELKLLQMHCGYGVKMMQPVEDLARPVQEIILFHHEMLDGSGFPKGLKGDEIGQPVRIVTIANAYDNLCNPRVASRAKTPAEALSHMYKNEAAKYDKVLLSAFIKAMGVYPPGTVVLLKSGKVGIVMSVDASDLLHPNLMIYDPSVPKLQAAIVNLRRDLEDEVVRTLRPSMLPKDVFDYLSPRKRISYFVDSAG